MCKAVLEMSVVPTSDGEEDGVLWLRCPRCHGFLPKISDSVDEPRRVADPRPAAGEAPDPELEPEPGFDEVAPASAAANPPPAAVEVAPPAPMPDFDPETAIPYRPWNRFEIGAVIRHLAWDDFGVVLAKEILPGNRHAVKVQFEKAGVVRLIEDSGELT
ncbi:MAG: hypothetical protein ACYDIE_06865 [Candidatus Krumholzibacteriia bacterium]